MFECSFIIGLLSSDYSEYHVSNVEEDKDYAEYASYTLAFQYARNYP